MRQKLFLLLLGLVLLGCTSLQEDVPSEAVMFRADAQNSGVYQTEGVKQKPELSRSFSTRDLVRSEVIVLDDTAYISEARSGVKAIDAETGRQKWFYHVPNHPFRGVRTSVAVVGDVVYFGAFDFYFYALEAETGETRWRHEVQRVLSSPTVSSEVVYFKEADAEEEYLTALDGKSGQRLWRQAIEAYNDSAPAVAEGKVVVLERTGFVSAFDAMTGEPLWEYQTSQPVQWQWPWPAFPIALAVADGHVYASSIEHLYAIDAETGTASWQFKADKADKADWALYLSPAVSEGVVYVSSLEALHAIDGKTGEELWRFANEEVIYQSPVIADGYLYIVGIESGGGFHGSASNRLKRYIYALDPSTGEMKWQLSTHLRLDSRITISDGALYVGGQKQVFKFE